METIKLSSQLLQASITALVYLLLISTFAVNDFLWIFYEGIKVITKSFIFVFKTQYCKLLIKD